MSAPPVIEVSGLSYRYEDGTEALRGVDFTLGAGESVALLGPNGSGKTTFLLHLNGILRGPGRITVCGLPVAGPNLTAIRRKVGFLFQDPDEQLFLPTVLEDAAFGPLQEGCSPEEAAARARLALEQVGITHDLDRPPTHLSKGEKQRVALAGILACRPEILVLDEPTTHLDPPARRQLLALLSRLDLARILVTHDVEFARALCRRAVFFSGGRVAADGPIEDVIARMEWAGL